MLGDIAVGDGVRLRKRHPCGGLDWEVARLGADIGLNCLVCDRQIMLSRAELEKKVNFVVSRRLVL